MDIKTRRAVAKQLLQAAAKLEGGPSTADQIDGLKKMVEGLDKAYQDFLTLNDEDGTWHHESGWHGDGTWHHESGWHGKVANLTLNNAGRNMAGLTKAIENTAALLAKKLKEEFQYAVSQEETAYGERRDSETGDEE